MKKIGIVILYFGKLPENMETFLMSCGKNKSINWLIFTDQPFEQFTSAFDNVNFFKSSLTQVKEKIIDLTGIQSIELNHAYKISDYKPLYGEVFADKLIEFDYWGYSDIDVVYGNLMKFIQTGIEQNFDKIGAWGHLTLIRNCTSVNERYKLPITVNGEEHFLFRDEVSQTAKICHFDESDGINIIYQQHNFKTFNNPDLVNDILFENLDLLTNDKRFNSRKSCYVWDKGKARFFYKRNNKVFDHEYGYFHFQKRKFTKFIHEYQIKAFSITTHGYQVLNSIDESAINDAMKDNSSSLLQRCKYIYNIYCRTDMFTKFKIGKIYFPIKYIIWRIFVRRDFKI